MREKFPYKRSLQEYHFLEEIKKRSFFGYAPCDIEVYEYLWSNFSNSLPISKNTLVSKNDIGVLMKN